MNLIVVLRRLLTYGRCHTVLLVSSVSGFLAYLILSLKSGWIGGVQFACIGIAVLSLFLFFRYRFASTDWKRSTLKNMNLYDVSRRRPDTVRTKCFQRNCGVDPQATLSNAAWSLLGSVVLAAVGIAEDMIGYSVFGVIGSLWSVFVILFSMFYRQHIWTISLIQTTGLGVFALVSAMATRPQDLIGSGYDSTILLMFTTQLGNWRMGRTKAHSCLQMLFVSIAVLIAAVTMIAHSTATGFVFGSPPLEACLDEQVAAGTCTPIAFNLSGVKTPYEFCGLSWLMGRNGTTPGYEHTFGTVSERCSDTKLGIVDFGQISTVAGYLPNVTKVQLVLDQNLPGWEQVYSQVYNISEGHHNTFIHVKRGMTHVVAVRGTSSVVEALQDINLWMPVAFLQLAHNFGPSLYSTRSVLELLTHGSRELRAMILDDLVNYMRDVQAEYSGPGYKLYITGHSLGGGLATAVGTALGIPAITFSAPGLRATATILDPRPKDDGLIRQSVNVVPDRDPVPTVDTQAGTVLHIKCPVGGRLPCHRLMVTMCELLASCGDGTGRGIPRGFQRSCHTCAGVAGLQDIFKDQCGPQADAATSSDKGGGEDFDDDFSASRGVYELFVD